LPVSQAPLQKKDWISEKLGHLPKEEDADGEGLKRVDNVVSRLRSLLYPARPHESQEEQLLRRRLVEYRRASGDSGPGYHLAGMPLILLDVAEIEAHVKRARRLEQFGTDGLAEWQAAYDLAMRGVFLPGEAYSDWADWRRQAIETHLWDCVQVLWHRFVEQGAMGEIKALQILRDYWQRHVTNEDALRPLLELLGKCEWYGQAKEYYEQLCTALDLEGKQPDQRTRDIMDFQQSVQLQRKPGTQSFLRLSETRIVEASETPTHVFSAPHALSRPRGEEQPVAIDWGEAPSADQFYGREQELTELLSWIQAQHSQLVTLCGMGGIGKTSLAARLVDTAKDAFDYVFWRSLQQAPPLRNVLEECLTFLSDQQERHVPEDNDAGITLLVEHLRASRCLLIFDNYETVMAGGMDAGEYRKGYEDYGRFIRRIGEAHHQSCLVLTSREKMKELARLEGKTALTHTLSLQGIGLEEGRAILQEKGLVGSDEAYSRLLNRYAGNPLALKLIAEPILALFNADIAAFLQEDLTALSDINDIIAQQFTRLSERERTIMYWLVIEREPVSQTTLWEDDSHLTLSSRKELLDALMSLRRRSLIEGSAQQQLTLQPVVMEYVTESLIHQVATEIITGNIHLLSRHALLKAQSREYLREAQARLILAPFAEQLLLTLGREGVEQQCRKVLAQLHRNPTLQTGYAAGNLLNLLLFMQYKLHNYDFSHLSIRQAFLQGMHLTDVNFAGADFSTSVFTETFGCIFALAFHPDGKRIAAGTASGEIRLWNVQSGLPLMVYQGHTDWVRAVAFHPSEEIMASGSEDQTVRLWDSATGQCLKILQQHTNRVRSLAFSPDGKLLASGSEDQTIRLWDTQTGRCVVLLQGHTDQVRTVAFHPDGKSVVSGGEDQTIKLWDTQTGNCLRTISTPTAVFSVAYHPNGQQIVSGGDAHSLSLWESSTGICMNTLQGHSKRVRSVAFSSDGQRIISGSEDQTMKLWDTQTGSCMQTFSGHTNAIFSVAWSSDSAMVASGGEDQTVQIWEMRTGECIKVFRGYTDQIRSVAFSPDSNLMASGSEDQTVRLWNTKNGLVTCTFVGHQKRVRAVAFSPDGRLVASGSEDQTVRIWDVATSQCIRSLRGHTDRVRSVVFNPDGRLVASGSEDREVAVWDVANGQRLTVFRGHTNRVRSVVFSPDGRFLASGSEDQTVRVWNVATAQCLKILQGHTSWIWSISFSPDGRMIASGCEDGTIRLWQTASGECKKVLLGHTERIRAISFSPDGQFLASGSEDQTARLWNRVDGTCTHVFQGHTSWVWAVSFRPDGQALASGSHDGTIRLWNIHTGQCLSSLRSQRPYERMNIAKVSGLTTGQEKMLYELGAISA